MKALTCLLVLTCLWLAAAAQDVAKQPQANGTAQPKAPTASAHVSQDDEELSTLKENTTCYAIRAYLFNHPKTGVPEPVGMTTCVPNTQRQLKRVEKEPAPRLRLVY